MNEFFVEPIGIVHNIFQMIELSRFSSMVEVPRLLLTHFEEGWTTDSITAWHAIFSVMTYNVRRSTLIAHLFHRPTPTKPTLIEECHVRVSKHNIFKVISRQKWCLNYWKSIGLEMRLHKQEHVHSNTKGIWTMFEDETVSLLCLLLLFFLSLAHTDNMGYLLSLSDHRSDLIITPLFLMPRQIHFYWLWAI